MGNAPKSLWVDPDYIEDETDCVSRMKVLDRDVEYIRADLVNGLVEALEAMCEEFRLLDLPYGSEAYAKATDFLRKARGVE